ncbi:hypothetical protein [Halosaccharopolyspora lacisalsi]|uniref:hypothetical protein n=1 Tax=Halosaccharopolyspora lacisalsi TaxID=1000566 RepID=UPI0015F94834|nr:hypothetical protein [Halosaccharopolyspora lacisalsi]
MSAARIAAADAVAEHLGVAPLPDDDTERTPEQEHAVGVAATAFDAVIQKLGADPALTSRAEFSAVTVPELHEVYQRGM